MKFLQLSILCSLMTIVFAQSDFYVNLDDVLATQTISTLQLSAQSTAAAANPAGVNVAHGEGTNGLGDTCGCNCLCGTGMEVPSDAGLGSFGGAVGVMANQPGTAPEISGEM